MYALVCDDVPPVIASVLKSRVLAPKAPEPVATQPSAAAVNVWSPVSSLPVSACQLPASPVPVHPRKRGGKGKSHARIPRYKITGRLIDAGMTVADEP